MFSLVIGMAIFVKAEDYQVFPCGPFGTLNNTDNPIMVPNTMAQDLLNVEISKDGRYVKKREGYSVSNTLAVTGSAVHGIYNFKNLAGQNVSLFFNDDNISASVNDGATTIIYSSGTLNATYDCVDYNGLAYCVNNSSAGLYFINGTSAGKINVAVANATGTMITATPGRLVMAGNGSNPNTVFFSKSYDFATWSIGALDTDSIYFTITAPGAKITHITFAFGKVVWFKDSSFGYISEGATQADWQITTINNSLGTLDNESVYWNGLLYFRGNDYHFYSYDGSTLQRLSGDILATVATMFSSNGSWEQTTSEEFADGSFSPSNYIDTTTINGTITFDYPDGFSTFRDGTSGTRGVWGKHLGGSAAGVATVAGGYLKLESTGSSLGTLSAYTLNSMSNLTSGATISVELKDMTAGTSGSVDYFYIVFSSWTGYVHNTYTDGLVSSGSVVFKFPRNSLSFGLYEIYYTIDGTRTQLYIDSGWDDYRYSTHGLPKIDIYLSATSYQITMTTGTTSTIYSAGSFAGTNTNPYVFLSYQRSNIGNGTISMDNFSIYPQTATFRSAVQNITAMSTWSLFTADYQNNGGSNTFYMRSSNSVFTKDAASPAWTAVTPGAIPTLATGTYFQVRDDLSITTNGTAPSLSSFIVNYLVGSAPSDRAYASYFDDKIWWSVTSGIGQTTNNKLLVFDIQNNGWLIHDIPVNGFMVKNNSLFFGSPTAGYVYKYGGTNSDNGAAISSYWKSKDFFFDNPFTEKEFPNISFVSNSYAGAYATATYTLNGSSETAIQYSLYTANSEFTQYNKNLPIGKVGKTFSIKYGNEAANQPWELYGIQIGWRPRAWRPTP